MHRTEATVAERVAGRCRGRDRRFSGASLGRFPGRATYEGNNGRIAFGAFAANDRRQADIWSTRPGEDDLHQLTDAPGRDICPAYSPDGKHIAFCSDRTGAFEIWVMDANGKHERQVTALGTSSTFPDFSPDGGLLAFSSEPAGGGNTDLWIVPTDGGAPTQVTDTPDALEEYPAWSPDGTTILFVRIAGDFSGGQLWTARRRDGPRRPS